MTAGAAPLWEQLAILILGPPIMAALWWLGSRGFALTIQGGTVSERTKKRQKKELYVLAIVLYVIVFSMALYAWLR